MATTATRERFFVSIEGLPWVEVTRQKFREVERKAGFHRPTGGFTGGGLQGRVHVEGINTPDQWSWDPEFRAAVLAATT